MMILKKQVHILAAFLLCTSLLSCNKEPGEGGTSSIQGKVLATYYNETFTAQLGESYAPDKDVYIVYGDDATYSDKQKTNYDGSFEFKYLRKGKYRIYAYSKDTTLTNPTGKFAVYADVEITKKGETVVVSDIKIADN